MEELLYIEAVDEVNVGDSDILTSLRELLRDLAANMEKYARQYLMVAILFLNITNASAIDLMANTPANETVVEYVMPQSAKENQAEKMLNNLNELEDDWDGYGSPRISWVAIAHCRKVVAPLSTKVAKRVQVLPTEYGGVQIKTNLKNGGVLSCDFGDETMSYYVERPDKETEFVSFVPYSAETLQKLNAYLVL
jgi:hypothetical protein